MSSQGVAVEWSASHDARYSALFRVPLHQELPVDGELSPRPGDSAPAPSHEFHVKTCGRAHSRHRRVPAAEAVVAVRAVARRAAASRLVTADEQGRVPALLLEWRETEGGWQGVSCGPCWTMKTVGGGLARSG
jgi:hypothetical protein